MRRSISRVFVVGVSIALLASAATSFAAAAPVRSLKVVVSHDAPAAVKEAAAQVVAAAKTSPLLKLFAGDRPVELVESEQLLAAMPAERAYAHLVLVGLMSDPMIQQAWQHEARAVNGNFYVFGFGTFAGDLGYIESDRNPFLHAKDIAATPFETEIVTVTGTAPAGVTAAATALAKQGLVNGVVSVGTWSRVQAGLLDRDPLAANFSIPPELPEKIGTATRIGVTQPSEDEYRGVLQDAGVEPAEMWRAKYYVAGAWDGKGFAAAFKAYYVGLHRRAADNTLWAARFESEDQASAAAVKIARAADLAAKRGEEFYVGKQPPFTANDSPGSLTLWRKGVWVFMSTLPVKASDLPR